MKKKQEFKRQNFLSKPRTIAIFVLVAGVVGTIVIGALSEKTTNSGLNKKTNSFALTNPNPYSEKQIHDFWDSYLNKVVMEELVPGKYHIPEINKRFLVLSQATAKRCGGYNISPSTSYNEHSRLVVAGCAIKDSVPQLIIFVPAVMDIHAMLRIKSAVDHKKQFEVTVVTLVMHELDHIAGGWIGTPDQSRAELVRGEIDAWAETCKHTLKTFVKYGYTLGPSEKEYYDSWVYCGQAKNECWKSFIQKSQTPVSQFYRE